MVVGRWLYEEMLVSFRKTLEPIVTECREGMRQDSILIVLGDTSQLYHTVELFR